MTTKKKYISQFSKKALSKLTQELCETTLQSVVSISKKVKPKSLSFLDTVELVNIHMMRAVDEIVADIVFHEKTNSNVITKKAVRRLPKKSTKK